MKVSTNEEGLLSSTIKVTDDLSMLSSLFVIEHIPIALTMYVIVADEVFELVICKVLGSFSDSLEFSLILTITNHCFVINEELLDCGDSGVEGRSTKEPQSLNKVLHHGSLLLSFFIGTLEDVVIISPRRKRLGLSLKFMKRNRNLSIQSIIGRRYDISFDLFYDRIDDRNKARGDDLFVLKQWLILLLLLVDVIS